MPEGRRAADPAAAGATTERALTLTGFGHRVSSPVQFADRMRDAATIGGCRRLAAVD